MSKLCVAINGLAALTWTAMAIAIARSPEIHQMGFKYAAVLACGVAAMMSVMVMADELRGNKLRREWLAVFVTCAAVGAVHAERGSQIAERLRIDVDVQDHRAREMLTALSLQFAALSQRVEQMDPDSPPHLQSIKGRLVKFEMNDGRIVNHLDADHTITVIEDGEVIELRLENPNGNELSAPAEPDR